MGRWTGLAAGRIGENSLFQKARIFMIIFHNHLSFFGRIGKVNLSREPEGTPKIWLKPISYLGRTKNFQ